MAISKTEARLLSGSYDRVFRAACDGARDAGMTVVAADPAAGRIQLSTSMSMLTWGENLVVGVRSMSPDSTEVSVHSALKFGLVDWGRNRENIGNLFQRIAAAVNAPAGAWHPDPSGRHELRWWDGNGWTQNVSDRGQFGTDVL